MKIKYGKGRARCESALLISSIHLVRCIAYDANDDRSHLLLHICGFARSFFADGHELLNLISQPRIVSDELPVDNQCPAISEFRIGVEAPASAGMSLDLNTARRIRLQILCIVHNLPLVFIAEGPRIGFVFSRPSLGEIDHELAQLTRWVLRRPCRCLFLRRSDLLWRGF